MNDEERDRVPLFGSSTQIMKNEHKEVFREISEMAKDKIESRFPINQNLSKMKINEREKIVTEKLNVCIDESIQGLSSIMVLMLYLNKMNDEGMVVIRKTREGSDVDKFIQRTLESLDIVTNFISQMRANVKAIDTELQKEKAEVDS